MDFSMVNILVSRATRVDSAVTSRHCWTEVDLRVGVLGWARYRMRASGSIIGTEMVR